MVRNFRKISLGLVCVLAMPVVASAQSQMTGLVRDESGGVLPGVTVEAASPVLIEKMRSAITDANGRFTIGDLRQGVYTVTFSLTGFWTVVRDEFNLPGDFIATINVDMKVGALEEIITVRTRILTKSEVRISAAGRSIYNANQLDKNVPHKSIYNGLDVAVQGRMAGLVLIGSWTTERNRSVFCSSDDNPNGPSTGDLYTGASVSQGGRFCDQREFDIPLTRATGRARRFE